MSRLDTLVAADARVALLKVLPEQVRRKLWWAHATADIANNRWMFTFSFRLDHPAQSSLRLHHITLHEHEYLTDAAIARICLEVP